MFLIKYLIVLFGFVISTGCDPNNNTSTKTPPAANTTTKSDDQGVVYEGTVTITNRNAYEKFLENARFNCRNSGAFGFYSCSNWTGYPGVRLVFNRALTQLTSFTLYPKGSGSWITGNNNQTGVPIFIQQSGHVNKVNEDEGWMVSLNINNVTTLIFYCEYCDLEEGDLDDLRLYRGSRDFEMGTVSVTRESSSSTTAIP